MEKTGGTVKKDVAQNPMAAKRRKQKTLEPGGKVGGKTNEKKNRKRF